MAEPAKKTPSGSPSLRRIGVSDEFAQWLGAVTGNSRADQSPFTYLLEAWLNPDSQSYIKDVFDHRPSLPKTEQEKIDRALNQYFDVIGKTLDQLPITIPLKAKVKQLLNNPVDGTSVDVLGKISNHFIGILQVLSGSTINPQETPDKNAESNLDTNNLSEEIPPKNIEVKAETKNPSTTAVVPPNLPGIPPNFTELSISEQTRISSQVLSIQAGFAQNQAAIAFWHMAGQPVPDNPFAALPPEVQAALRSNAIKTVMAAAATGKPWNTLDTTHSTILATLAENPTIAVEINRATSANNLPTFTSEQPAQDLTEQLQQLDPTVFGEAPATEQFNELTTQQAVTTSYETATTKLQQYLEAAGLPPQDALNTVITLEGLVTSHTNLDVALAAAAADPNNQLLPWLGNHPQRAELYHALRHHGEEIKIAAAYATASSAPLVSFISPDASDELLQVIAQAEPGRVADLTAVPELQDQVAIINNDLRETAAAMGQAREELRNQVDPASHSILTIAATHTKGTTMPPVTRRAVGEAGINPAQAQSYISTFRDSVELPEANDPTIQRLAKWYQTQDTRNQIFLNLTHSADSASAPSSDYSGSLPPGDIVIYSQQADDLGVSPTATYDYGSGGSSPFSPGGIRNWWQKLFNRKPSGATKEAVNKVRGIKRFSQFVLETTKKVKQALQGSKIVATVGRILPALIPLVKPLLFLLGGGALLWGASQLLSGLGSLVSNLFGLATGGSKVGLAGMSKAGMAGQTTGLSGATQAGTSGVAQLGGTSTAGQAAGLKSTIGNAFANPVMQIGALGGGVSVALIGASTLQNIFLNPLPLAESLESPYVNIDKVAVRGGNTVTELSNSDLPTDITYRITISPKENYTISINGYFDSMGVRFNQEAYQARSATPPTVSSITRNSSNPSDFTVVTPETVTTLEPGKELVLEYTQAMAGDWQDAAVQNDFTLQFDYSSPTESGTSEIADARATLCIGECPVAQAGLWPSCGRISQMPYNEPRYDGVSLSSHSACGSEPCVSAKGSDAFDISAVPGVPVHASFNGRVCARPYDESGYGTYLKLNQIPGADFEIIYAHMSSTIFGSSSSACQDVRAGDYLGLTGNTGNSTNIHLHYELTPPVGLQSRLIDYVPDQNVTPGFMVTQCYAASR